MFHFHYVTKWPKNWKSEPEVETYLDGKQVPRAVQRWVEIGYRSMSWVVVGIFWVFIVFLDISAVFRLRMLKLKT